MALIKCNNCGKEISDKSKKCIHCGTPIISNITENKTNKTKIKFNTKDILIIITLSIFSIINFMYNHYNFIVFGYFIVYVGCYWLIFLYFKNRKLIFKRLSGIALLLSIVMHFVTCTIIYDVDRILIISPTIYVFYEFILTFTPLFILYLITLQGEKIWH